LGCTIVGEDQSAELIIFISFNCRDNR